MTPTLSRLHLLGILSLIVLVGVTLGATTLVVSDGDRLSLIEEHYYGTSPHTNDTDGDGLDDGVEVHSNTDPTKVDTDGDGLTDGVERAYGTNPAQADTDGDGLTDREEQRYATDPTTADTDNDGLNDSKELTVGTNPTIPDTDDDGLTDGAEYHNTTLYPDADPLQKDIYIEVDEMQGQTLPRDEADTIATRFRNAPIDNPDGSTGINVHFRYDDTIPNQDRSTEVDFAALYLQQFNHVSQGYHYLIVVDNAYNNGENVNGAGREGAMMVESFDTPDKTGRIAMHELGHSLGLDKRVFKGIDSYTYSYTDYPSVLNYNSPDTVYTYSTGDSSPNDFNDWEFLTENMYTPPAS